MDGIFTSPPNGGGLSTFTSNKEAIVLSEEIVSFPIRKNIVISSPNGTLTAGTLAFTVSLDSLLDAEFLSKFEYYSLQDPQLDLQCTAPIGTASGAMLVAQFTDVLNGDVPTDVSEAFAKFGNTLGSVIIRPRDNKSLKLDVSSNPMFGNWRYTKIDTANPRLSSFGVVAGIILEPGAIGDGTTYTGWFHAHLLGKRRTVITGGIASQIYLDCSLFGSQLLPPVILYEDEQWSIASGITMANTSYAKNFPVANTSIIMYLPKTVIIHVRLLYTFNEKKYDIDIDVPVNTMLAKSDADGAYLTTLIPLPSLSSYPVDSQFELKGLVLVPVQAICHFTYTPDPALLHLSLNSNPTLIPPKGFKHRMVLSQAQTDSRPTAPSKGK